MIGFVSRKHRQLLDEFLERKLIDTEKNNELRQSRLVCLSGQSDDALNKVFFSKFLNDELNDGKTESTTEAIGNLILSKWDVIKTYLGQEGFDFTADYDGIFYHFVVENTQRVSVEIYYRITSTARYSFSKHTLFIDDGDGEVLASNDISNSGVRLGQKAIRLFWMGCLFIKFLDDSEESLRNYIKDISGQDVEFFQAEVP